MDISLSWNGEEILNPAIFNSVLIVFILSIFFIICGLKVKKADPSKPTTGLVLFLELFVNGVEGFVTQVMGKKNVGFSPYIGMLAIYLAAANLSGLVGLTPPTSNYSITLAMAVMTIVLMVGSGIKAKGVGGYLWDTYFGDIPVLMPLHLMGEIAKPISLSFRLFGNILSGTIILALVTTFAGYFSVLVFPVLNIYFDMFAGLIQTMIFCMLTMIWSLGAMEGE